MMLVKRSLLLISVATSLMLNGCSLSPKQTESDIPLVHASLAYSLSQKSDDLFSRRVIATNGDTSFMLDNVSYNIARQYKSVSGLECVQLAPIESSSEKINRSACQKQGQWILLPLLVTDTSSKE